MSHQPFRPHTLSLSPSLFFSKVIHTPKPHAPHNITRCLRQHHRHHLSPPPLKKCPSAPSRPFTTTRPPLYKTVEEARSRKTSGPFSIRAAVIFLATGAAMISYFQYEKARVARQRIADAAKGVGKPKVGGKFELVDHEGRGFGDGDLRGGFSLVYFGFTHCPDICPEELDKMAHMIDIVSPSSRSFSHSPSTLPSPSPTSSSSSLPSTSQPSPSQQHPRPRPPLLPLVITCDPARDTPSVLKSYLAEFHPAMLGLTGTWEQIKQVCKAYRVYFSTPEGVKPGMDYLVDHSIYFYLMDPEGDFIEAIGRQHTAEQAAKIILAHMSDWDGVMKKKK